VTELDFSSLRAQSTKHIYDVYPSSLTESGAFTGYISKSNAPFALLHYHPLTGFEDLGGYLPGGHSRGIDINEAGVIAVEARRSGTNRPVTFSKFDGVGVVELGSLGRTNRDAENVVRFINEQGQVAGASELPSGDLHAFRWSQSNGMEDLGTLGGWFSTGNGINESGWVSGSSRATDGSFHVFLAKPDEAMVDLGPGIGGDINNRGTILALDPSGLPNLIYDGKWRRMTPNFGVAQYSVGNLNELNLVNGTYFDFRLGVGFTAIVGSERYGVVDLNKLIPTNSGWVLVEGTGMNNKCQIVGKGWNGNAGRNTLFRLDPVVPPLSIRHAGAQVELAWSETFFPLVLESADQPDLANWLPIADEAVNRLTIPLEGRARFFRLRLKPPPGARSVRAARVLRPRPISASPVMSGADPYLLIAPDDESADVVLEGVAEEPDGSSLSFEWGEVVDGTFRRFATTPATTNRFGLGLHELEFRVRKRDEQTTNRLGIRILPLGEVLAHLMDHVEKSATPGPDAPEFIRELTQAMRFLKRGNTEQGLTWLRRTYDSQMPRPDGHIGTISTDSIENDAILHLLLQSIRALSDGAGANP
jgi:probable HAF family extracellular repeat protein